MLCLLVGIVVAAIVAISVQVGINYTKPKVYTIKRDILQGLEEYGPDAILGEWQYWSCPGPYYLRDVVVGVAPTTQFDVDMSTSQVVVHDNTGYSTLRSQRVRYTKNKQPNVVDMSRITMTMPIVSVDEESDSNHLALDTVLTTWVDKSTHIDIFVNKLHRTMRHSMFSIEEVIQNIGLNVHVQAYNHIRVVVPREAIRSMRHRHFKCENGTLTGLQQTQVHTESDQLSETSTFVILNNDNNDDDDGDDNSVLNQLGNVVEWIPSSPTELPLPIGVCTFPPRESVTSFHCQETQEIPWTMIKVLYVKAASFLS